MSSSLTSFKQLLLANWPMTAIYCAIYWSYGMCVAFLGPTLFDLGCVIATPLSRMSWLFFSQLLFTLVGSMLAGYLVKRFDALFLLFISTLIIPLAMFLLPFCKVLVALALVLCLMGVNMGSIDCLANLQMIRLYGVAVAPFLHALYFCYGVGAFLSPMIAQPFLINRDCTPLLEKLDVHTGKHGITIINVTVADALAQVQAETRVEYAFVIMATLQLPVPVVLGWLIRRLRSKGWSFRAEPAPVKATGLAAAADAGGGDDGACLQTPLNGTYTEDGRNANSQDIFWGNTQQQFVQFPGKTVLTQMKSLTAQVSLTTGVIMFIFDGLQFSYGDYVYEYALKNVYGLRRLEGAYLNACYWGTFAIGRLLSIYLATKFSALVMLLCEIIGCQLAMVLMLSLQHNHAMVYVGSCLFGLFLSSTTPTALSLAEQFITITPFVTAFMLVIASIGETVCPVIVGNIFVTRGPGSFLVFGNIMCLLALCVFGGFWYFGTKSPKFQGRQLESLVWCEGWSVVPQSTEEAVEGVPMTVRHIKYGMGVSEDSTTGIGSTMGSDELANVATAGRGDSGFASSPYDMGGIVRNPYHHT